jgi:hypothetical protein
MHTEAVAAQNRTRFSQAGSESKCLRDHPPDLHWRGQPPKEELSLPRIRSKYQVARFRSLEEYITLGSNFRY